MLPVKHTPGKHCGSTGLRDLVNFHGLDFDEPACFGMGGVTFAKWLNLKGIASVGWGPGDDNAFHVADEYIPIDEVPEGMKAKTLSGTELRDALLAEPDSRYLDRLERDWIREVLQP